MATMRTKVAQVLQHASEQARLPCPPVTSLACPYYVRMVSKFCHASTPIAPGTLGQHMLSWCSCSPFKRDVCTHILASLKAEGNLSCIFQVMAALREGRASTSGMANGGSVPMAATPRGATPRANGRGGYAVAESVQQALLYVRFRTAAEAGLKGDVHQLPHLCDDYPPASGKTTTM